MLGLLLETTEYGGYISIIKLVVFLVLFFGWLPVLGWVHQDSENIGTKKELWTGICLASIAIATLMWLLIPVFIVGMLVYLIAVAAAAMSYVMHRNAIVPACDRILTAEHLSGLFSSKDKTIHEQTGLVFITANGNEVSVPETKTTEFFGYRTAHSIFTDAIWRRADDIIFAPVHQGCQVVYNIDGTGVKQLEIAKDDMDYFARFIKNLADLDPDEKRKPQKGKFDVQQNKKAVEWELSCAGSTEGEKIWLKRTSGQSISKLSELGLTQTQYDKMANLQRAKQGIFIISGPGKSGVTSTFYSLLRGHDAFINSICTLEKQPATDLPNITQNVFTLQDTGTTTYAEKLQKIVRMGPDIVGVADCQKTETAQIICNAARETTLMYVTLEADSVIRALDKWIKMTGNRLQAAEMMLGISCQKLLRKLCDECKQAYEPNKELLKKFNLPADKAKILYRPGKVQYDKHGKPRTCENCQGTGFFGRIGIFELIVLNVDMRKVVQQAKSMSEISTNFRRAKMFSLQEQALRAVLNGTTSINEMVRVLSKPKDRKVKAAGNGGKKT